MDIDWSFLSIFTGISLLGIFIGSYLGNFIDGSKLKKGFGYFSSALKWRKNYPDTMLVLTNSLRGDLEAFLIGAKLRIGMVREYWRPLLNAIWKASGEALESHQARLWEGLLRNFGLQEELQLQPLHSRGNDRRSSDSILRVGIAPGSSNTPGKRFPVKSWIEICEILSRDLHGSKVSIEIFGTNQDKSLCREIKKALPEG